MVEKSFNQFGRLKKNLLSTATTDDMWQVTLTQHSKACTLISNLNALVSFGNLPPFGRLVIDLGCSI